MSEAAERLAVLDLREEVPEAAQRLLAASGAAAFPAEAVASVRAILEAVRVGGDAALVELTARYDRVALTPETLRVDPAQVRAAAARAPAELRRALEAMIAQVRSFHQPQAPTSYRQAGPDGVELGFTWSPVRAAALYVPGGTAAYPTTVVMNAVPAQIAGVERIVVLTPPGTLQSNPAVAAALDLLGLEEIYQIGGAQAVAAAAYGTARVPRVDVIVGPGNLYVALAKREVYGLVGIDAVAGPSEVAILADASAPARYIAADLIAQAEHDAHARCFLLTPSAALAAAVQAELTRQIAAAPRRAIIEAALRDQSAILLTRDLAQAVAISNALAPEHLQVMVSAEARLEPEALIGGAIFWGPDTPTALGDYWAGPNHVLPTGGAARFSGPLSVATFLRSSSYVRYTAAAIQAAAPQAALIADHEALHGHAAALRARTERGDEAI